MGNMETTKLEMEATTFQEASAYAFGLTLDALDRGNIESAVLWQRAARLYAIEAQSRALRLLHVRYYYSSWSV